MIELDIYPILVWLTAILIGSIDIVVFFGSSRRSSRSFALSIMWVTLWIAASGVFISAISYELASAALRIMYFLGISISIWFLYFFLSYPDDRKLPALFIYILIILQLIFLILIFYTNTIVFDPFRIESPTRWGWHFGNLFVFYNFAFLGFFIYGIATLYRKFISSHSIETKNNLKFMLWVIVVGLIPPSIFSLILPQFGFYDLEWLGPTSEVIWIPILSYSIIKYRQMDVRAVVTEVLAIGMTVIFFINIFIQAPLGIWGRIVPFIVFLILAAYLIRGVLREASQKEQLSDLNQHLEQRVAEQTAEIRTAYDLEKKARRDLEKLNETKDQFILMTQHHLRTPVMGISRELATIQGAIDEKSSPMAHKSAKRMSVGIGRLIRIVDDFLSITALKVGTPILSIENRSLRPIIEEVLGDLAYDIEHRHISVTIDGDDKSWADIPIDPKKIREVLQILIENAIRYNHESGWVKIYPEIAPTSFRMIVEDGGAGFSASEKGKIESSLFFRSEHAKTAHPIGMGVGLTIVRAMMKAHGGTFSIHSDGKDSGAKAIIEFPLG